MQRAGSRRRGLLARLARALGFSAVALLVVLGIAVAFFPFERLAPVLAGRIQHETGAEARIASVGARFGLRGPELALQGVSLRWASGDVLALDELQLRAARPSAWLRGVPTAHVSLKAGFGAFDGDVSRERLRGDFARFDFAQLPSAWFGEGGAPLAGAVDAHVDLSREGELGSPERELGAGSWSGGVSLAGGEGSLALPGSPVAIPYQRLDAAARLDHAGTLHLDSLTLAGPMISARASGSVASGPAGLASGALAIDAEIDRIDPALLPSLQQYGFRLDAGGAGRVSISGTPGQIVVR